MDVSPEKPANEEPAKPDPSAPAPDSSAAPPDRSPPEPPPPPLRRAAGVSVLGAATAVLGIVLAVVGIASLVVSRDNGVSALDARLAGLELDLRELAARAPPASADPKILEEVANRLAKLEAAGRAAPSSGDPALANRIAALETEVKTLAEAVGALGRRNEELAQKLPDASAAVRSELEVLANRVRGVERDEKAVESGDRAVRLALAANALNAAVERGEPFATALATVKALGGDPKLVAALEPFAASGVPSAAALSRLADAAGVRSTAAARWRALQTQTAPLRRSASPRPASVAWR